MGIEDVGGTLAVVVSALVAGGAGYKLLEKILDLWSTSDARTSANWREYAEKMEARLDATEAEVDGLRSALDAERGTRIRQEDECAARLAELRRRVTTLEAIIRGLGGHVPGDTPARGTTTEGTS